MNYNIRALAPLLVLTTGTFYGMHHHRATSISSAWQIERDQFTRSKDTRGMEKFEKNEKTRSIIINPEHLDKFLQEPDIKLQFNRQETEKINEPGIVICINLKNDKCYAVNRKAIIYAEKQDSTHI